jgi:hypothetical protein
LFHNKQISSHAIHFYANSLESIAPAFSHHIMHGEKRNPKISKVDPVVASKTNDTSAISKRRTTLSNNMLNLYVPYSRRRQQGHQDLSLISPQLLCTTLERDNCVLASLEIDQHTHQPAAAKKLSPRTRRLPSTVFGLSSISNCSASSWMFPISSKGRPVEPTTFALKYSPRPHHCRGKEFAKLAQIAARYSSAKRVV